MGTYNLEETKTIDGLVLNKEPIEITLKKQDNTTKVYTKDVTVKNKTTLVQIYKVDKESKEQIKGAKLALYDDEGKEVTNWISSRTPYVIEGLNTNKEYEIKELEAPEGYNLLNEVYKFKVNDSEELQKVEIENEKTKHITEIPPSVNENKPVKKLPKTGF